ncbi:MAG: hypothetical protein VKJ09_11485 [Leptolyngbya sp.]|nr:hypothetical protein [Leptolyngbya sp.]
MIRMQPLQRWSWMGLVAGFSVVAPAAAQTFPPCPPPAPAEYLLLAQGNTEAERDRIQALLPTSTDVMVCEYLSQSVVRAGGFTSLENANAWAQYLTDVEGVQTFVARPAAPGEAISAAPPPETPAATATPPATIPTAEPMVAYGPQLLGQGYAVLVDYGDDPAIAASVQQTLGAGVGLAVYQQQPYLLALQSGDPQVAARTLQTLSAGEFTAFIVDSSTVVLLSPAIAVTP